MAFEIFTETGTRKREFISVTGNKTFGLSRAFMDKYSITKNHKAVILYDKDKNEVALHFSRNNPNFGLTVRISNPKHGGIVGARGFFETKDIDAKKYADRYDFERKRLTQLGLPQAGEAFVIKLRERPTTISAQPKHTESSVNEPINLDDIPF